MVELAGAYKMIKMLKQAGPKIDTNGNSATVRRAKMVKLVKMVKAVKPAGAQNR